MPRLQGKVAIVTGASRGIGAAIAEAFAAEGAKVVIASRKIDGLTAVADDINSRYPGSVFPRACHTGTPEQAVELVKWTEDNIGLPTVLVNNAATNPYFGPMLNVEWGAWDKTFDVNVKGYFTMSREVAQRLVDTGQSGSIINISSIFGLHGAKMQGVYAMTKAAVISMTETFAHELGRAGIRFNAICPGLVETRFASMLLQMPEIAASYKDRSALGDWAQPSEIAPIAVFLASDESKHVTAQKFVIDGGWTSGI